VTWELARSGAPGSLRRSRAGPLSLKKRVDLGPRARGAAGGFFPIWRATRARGGDGSSRAMHCRGRRAHDLQGRQQLRFQVYGCSSRSMASGLSGRRWRSLMISSRNSFRLPAIRSARAGPLQVPGVFSAIFLLRAVVPSRRNFRSSDVYHGESKIVNHVQEKAGTTGRLHCFAVSGSKLQNLCHPKVHNMLSVLPVCDPGAGVQLSDSRRSWAEYGYMSRLFSGKIDSSSSTSSTSPVSRIRAGGDLPSRLSSGQRTPASPSALRYQMLTQPDSSLSSSPQGDRGPHSGRRGRRDGASRLQRPPQLLAPPPPPSSSPTKEEMRR